jgi:hypothetical protein
MVAAGPMFPDRSIAQSECWMRLVCTDVTEKSLGEVLQKCRFVALIFHSALKNWWVLRLSVSSCCIYL